MFIHVLASKHLLLFQINKHTFVIKKNICLFKIMVSLVATVTFLLYLRTLILCIIKCITLY